MTATIDEADYDIEIRKQARELKAAVEDTGEDPINLIMDVLDGHSWFAQKELTGADYGAIIADFTHYNADITQYRDPESLVDSHDFETTLRRMAFAEFETDVLEAYKEGDFET